MLDTDIELKIYNSLVNYCIQPTCVIYTTSATDALFKPYLYLALLDKENLADLQNNFIKNISDSTGIDYVSPSKDKVIRLRGNSLILFLDLLNIKLK